MAAADGLVAVHLGRSSQQRRERTLGRIPNSGEHKLTAQMGLCSRSDTKRVLPGPAVPAVADGEPTHRS